MNYSSSVPAADNGGSGGRLVPTGAAVPATPSSYYPTGAAADAAFAAEPGFHLNLLEYWRILNKRKWLIISIAAAVLVLGAVKTLMTTPLYTAAVRLQIDRNIAKIVEGGNVTPAEGSDLEFMRTQYELLNSRTMAERVASSLKLGDDQDFLNPRDFSPLRMLSSAVTDLSSGEISASERASRERAAAGIIVANHAVKPVAGSRLVDITYTDPVPSRAQRIANAYAEAFIASNLDKRFEANSYAKTFLEDQINQLKARLEESEAAVLDFAQKQEIVEVSEKSSIAETNLAGAYSSLGTFATERIKNEQLWKQVELGNHTEFASTTQQ